MKKFLLLFVLIIPMKQARSCDICGCGVGNNYIGILPDFNKHIIGLRYRQNALLTHVGVGGSSSYLTSYERYLTAELWAGWNIGSKFRLMASVPYSFNERENQGLRLRKSGPGDIFVSGFYNLLNSRKGVANKLIIQSLWVGGGIKAPTGKYNPVDKANTSENANLFQLGTGSTDLTLNAMYDFRINDAGINATALYKINTINKYDYGYGNKLSLNAQVYYKWRIKDLVTLAPNTGFSFEKAGRDTDRKIPVDVSGGTLGMGTMGMEASFKNFSTGVNFQTPVSQNLASGIVKARDRFMIHISVLL